MSLTPFYRERVNKKFVFLMTICLLVGFILQAACSPSGIHHLRDWVKPGSSLQVEDGGSVLRQSLLHSPFNEPENCGALESFDNLVPNNKPRTSASLPLGPILVNQDSLFIALYQGIPLISNFDVILQSSLFDLKTSFLFYH